MKRKEEEKLLKLLEDEVRRDLEQKIGKELEDRIRGELENAQLDGEDEQDVENPAEEGSSN